MKENNWGSFISDSPEPTGFPWASQGVLMVKNLPATAWDIRDAGSIPESGRSPGEVHGNPFQYLCLGNPMAEEPGRLWSIKSHRVRHNWSNLACIHQSLHPNITEEIPRIFLQSPIKIWIKTSILHGNRGFNSPHTVSHTYHCFHPFQKYPKGQRQDKIVFICVYLTNFLWGLLFFHWVASAAFNDWKTTAESFTNMGRGRGKSGKRKERDRTC